MAVSRNTFASPLNGRRKVRGCDLIVLSVFGHRPSSIIRLVFAYRSLEHYHNIHNSLQHHRRLISFSSSSVPYRYRHHRHPSLSSSTSPAIPQDDHLPSPNTSGNPSPPTSPIHTSTPTTFQTHPYRLQVLAHSMVEQLVLQRRSLCRGTIITATSDVRTPGASPCRQGVVRMDWVRSHDWSRCGE